MTGFWRSWLVVWAIFVAAFGAMLAGAAVEATTGPLRLFSALLLQRPLPAELVPEFRFMTAVCGAVSIGWAVGFLAAFRAAAELPPPAAARLWRGLTLALMTWFVIDSILSVVTGFGMNVVPNIGLLATFLIPVVASGALKG